jgi:hypothetical protein
MGKGLEIARDLDEKIATLLANATAYLPLARLAGSLRQIVT